MEYLESTPRVEEFPKDDVERVVWAYGAVYQNRSLATGEPLVDVLLRRINQDGHIADENESCQVAVAQLDIVRLGSIWRGQKRLAKLWNKYGEKYYKTKKFIFDLEIHKPTSITFYEKYPNTKNEYLIPPFIYNLGKFKDDNNKKQNIYRFSNSTYTKLVTVDNKTVFIPSMELLTNTYTPRQQQIRNMLIMNPYEDILEAYIHNASIMEKTYIVNFKSRRDKSNLIFLSYLAMNKDTQISVQKLRRSMMKERRTKEWKPYPDRYPIVLPYHPKSLSILLDYIEINSNTFLCLRINKYSLPSEYIIESHIPKLEQEDSDRPGDIQLEYTNNYHNKIDDNEDIPIVNDINPHVQAGVYNITSEIGFLDEDKVKFRCIEDVKVNTSNAYFTTKEEENITGLSSGFGNNQDSSSNTAMLRQQEIITADLTLEETRERIRNSFDIGDTIDALNSLIEEDISSLQRIRYLDKDAIRHENITMCTFLGIDTKNRTKWRYLNNFRTKKKVKKSDYVPRGCIIIELILNNGKSAYLLEIEKKPQGASFCGLIFNTNNGLIDSYIIRNVLEKILKNEGRYTRRRKKGDPKGKGSYSLDIFVTKKYTYTHTSIRGSFVKKMISVLEKDEVKKLFI